VGRIFDEVLAFVQRLKHKFELTVVKIEDRLFQVAHPAMHQLGALAGCLGAKVLPLQQDRPQAPTQWNGIVGDGGGSSDFGLFIFEVHFVYCYFFSDFFSIHFTSLHFHFSY
jgi:hypothetical protein